MERVNVVGQARENGVRLVRFLYCDNSNIIRGKAVHLSALEDRLASGVSLRVSALALNMLDRLQHVEGMGPVGEARLVGDPSTFVVLPYAPHSAAMLADIVRLDQTPWEACPRSFLRRMIGRAAEAGLRIEVGFDVEWSLAIKQDGRTVPYDASLCFSSVGMASAANVVDEIVAALEAQGVGVEQYYPELGHGQHEISLRHVGALQAADRMVLFRETVRNVAWRHGLYASFAPKPWVDQPGNGAHIHFSAWDPVGDSNLFYDSRAPYGLSALGRQFLAGVLLHLPGLLALTCPSYNSYRRLQPRSLSAAYVSYGPDNREAAVRIVSPKWNRTMQTTHLELKAADSSGNPYIALGGLIAAGLDGVERGLELPERLLALEDPACLSEEEREVRGMRRLPTSQGEALDALESDTVLMQALGGLAAPYIAVRRSEWEAFRHAGETYELAEHFYKY
ncbi:MAG TPA: glutamine synthetase family protein [Chloroflexota bacterium]